MEELAKDHPPLCKDCKHNIHKYYCTRFRHLIDGEPLGCGALRYGDPLGFVGNVCGTEGKYFEPKPTKPKKRSWWKRLLLEDKDLWDE